MSSPITDLLPEDQHADSWYSLGACCQLLQVIPGQLYVVMRDVGVRFGQLVDDVPYLRGSDLVTVAKRCGELRTEIARAVETVAETVPESN